MNEQGFTRRLPELMDDLAGSDDRYVDDVLLLTGRIRQRPSWSFPTRWMPGADRGPLTWAGSKQLVIGLTLLALLGLVAATALGIGSPSERLPAASVSNGWVAVSTMPGAVQVSSTDTKVGGAIYLLREGFEPRLVAGDDEIRRVCPAFSPDGTRLAFGEGTGADRTIVVVKVDGAGVVSGEERTRIAVGEDAPCPRWSADGTRIAYLDDGRVVVVLPDGSASEARAGDPPTSDWVLESHDDSPLLSPDGEWSVQSDGDGARVSRPDGSEPVLLAHPTSFYAIPAWSPDGREILYMEDVGRHVAIHIASVDRPQDLITLATLPVNGLRSWPGRGDVSWQPLSTPPPSTPPPSTEPAATEAPSPSPESFEAVVLRRGSVQDGTADLLVVAVDPNGREREIARLQGRAGPWDGIGYYHPPAAISPTGLLAIPKGPGSLMHWEIIDVRRPEAAPIVVPDIEQDVEQLQGMPYFSPDMRPGIFWGPDDLLVIPWYERVAQVCPSCSNLDWQVSFVDGRTGVRTANRVPLVHQCRTQFRSGRSVQDVDKPAAPDSTRFSCIAPDDSMVVRDTGAGTSVLITIDSDGDTRRTVEGTFAGWLEVRP